MNPLAEYHELRKRLFHLRWSHQGHESSDEDNLMDRMDGAWAALTSEERDQINREPEMEFPGPDETGAAPFLEDVDVETSPGPVRRLVAA